MSFVELTCERFQNSITWVFLFLCSQPCYAIIGDYASTTQIERYTIPATLALLLSMLSDSGWQGFISPVPFSSAVLDTAFATVDKSLKTCHRVVMKVDKRL